MVKVAVGRLPAVEAALDWAFRQGYQPGATEKSQLAAAEEYGAALGLTVELKDLGQWGFSLKFVEKTIGELSVEEIINRGLNVF